MWYTASRSLLPPLNWKLQLEIATISLIEHTGYESEVRGNFFCASINLQKATDDWKSEAYHLVQVICFCENIKRQLKFLRWPALPVKMSQFLRKKRNYMQTLSLYQKKKEALYLRFAVLYLLSSNHGYRHDAKILTSWRLRVFSYVTTKWNFLHWSF